MDFSNFVSVSTREVDLLDGEGPPYTTLGLSSQSSNVNTLSLLQDREYE